MGYNRKGKTELTNNRDKSKGKIYEKTKEIGRGRVVLAGTY